MGAQSPTHCDKRDGTTDTRRNNGIILWRKIMKIRLGFVSNSSSSSFVIIGDSGIRDTYDQINVVDNILLIGETGETEFGWGPEVITDISARVNLAAILAAHDTTQMDSFIATMKKVNPDIEKVSFHASEGGWNTCYVDHQSFDSMAASVYEDKDSLDRFIFDQNSEIHLDNDNY